MKKKLVLVLLMVVFILSMSVPVMGGIIKPITVIGIDNEIALNTPITIALHDDNTIKRAVITLSTSSEYAKDEIWFKNLYCSSDTTVAKLTFLVNGKGLSQPYGSIVQSFLVTDKGCKYFNSTNIPTGEYFLHITMYPKNQSGITEVIPINIK